ncbi:MAG: DNA polymerase III subunit beta [Candidatus Woykebacteria bacterium]
MRIEISKETFLKNVGIAAKAISARPTTPVLGNVLLKTQEGGVTLIGTNLDTTIKTWAPAKVVTEGEITVPARTLLEFISTLIDESITIAVVQETAEIKSGKTEAKIPTISAKEFPEPPRVMDAKASSVVKEDFLRAAKAVSIAASQDEGRPVLTGVLVKQDGEKTLLVATDGYRLASKELKKMKLDEVIIPARALVEAERIIGGLEEESLKINISSEDNLVVFSAGHIDYYTKLLAGEFPNVDSVIPKSFVTTMVINKEELLNGIKTVNTFARDLGNVLRMNVSGEGEVKLLASSGQVGEGSVELAANKIEGQEIQIAFNSRYLSEGLTSIPGESVEIRFAGPTNPAQIKSPEDESFIYIVMPVRTQT